MLETIIDIYMIVNVVALALLIYVGVELEEWWVYSVALDVMEEHRINRVGRIVMCTILTILFLPTMLVWFALVLIGHMIWWLLKLFCKIFREK